MVAVVIGAMGFLSSSPHASAQAGAPGVGAGLGPDFWYRYTATAQTVGNGTVFVGNTFDVTVELRSNSTDPFTATNVGLLYDPSSLQLVAGSIKDWVKIGPIFEQGAVTPVGCTPLASNAIPLAVYGGYEIESDFCAQQGGTGVVPAGGTMVMVGSSGVCATGGTAGATLAANAANGTAPAIYGTNPQGFCPIASMTFKNIRPLMLCGQTSTYGGPITVTNPYGWVSGTLPPALSPNGDPYPAPGMSCKPSATAPYGPAPTDPDPSTVDFVHMIAPIEVLSGPADVGTFATFVDSTVDQLPAGSNYFCQPPTAPLPGMGCKAAGGFVPTLLGASLLPPSELTITKSDPAPHSVVAGQPDTFTIIVTNTSVNGSGSCIPACSPWSGTITDPVPSPQFTVSGAAAAVNAGSPTIGAGCNTAAQSYSCAATLKPGDSIKITLNVTSSSSAGGQTPTNKACFSPNDADGALLTQQDPEDCASQTVQIIPPAVAWQKSPTSANVWLTNATSCNAIAPDQCNTFTFDEIMLNSQDPHGMGAFSFDIHYDVTQYQNPCVAVVFNYPAQPGNFNCPGIDLSPAAALFLAGGNPPNTADSRVLNCTVTIPLNGLIHVACASTGTWGTGPQWIGPQVMAHVTMVPQSALVEAIRPNKENGDISVVKDDQVTVTNSCGQPLNDGNPPTGSTLPGNPDCQGNPLLGVGPGGVLTGNPNGGETTQTIRRLEGDVNGDCVVDVTDMQLEASKFGQSIGGLLYNVFYDVNSPLQHGDGEIDINDIQFVFGRFNSNCGSQIPPQPPQPAP